MRRRIAGAPTQIAEGFARAVRSAPDSRLEQILRTPVRRAVLDGIFWQMPQHVSLKAVAGADATIRWRITGGPNGTDTYELEFRDGRCRTRRGESNVEPRVTITLDAAEFIRLATGISDPMQAYFKGRLKLGGDIMFAAKLQSLFHIPGRDKSGQPGKPGQPVSTVSPSR